MLSLLAFRHVKTGGICLRENTNFSSIFFWISFIFYLVHFSWYLGDHFCTFFMLSLHNFLFFCTAYILAKKILREKKTSFSLRPIFTVQPKLFGNCHKNILVPMVDKNVLGFAVRRTC